jgi:hypothetical protein
MLYVDTTWFTGEHGQQLQPASDQPRPAPVKLPSSRQQRSTTSTNAIRATSTTTSRLSDGRRRVMRVAARRHAARANHSQRKGRHSPARGGPSHEER